MIATCIRQAAKNNEIKLIELEVEPEHVHCIVEFSFAISVLKVPQLLKRSSARKFFQRTEKAKLRYPRGHSGGRGKFASSVGFIQLDVVKEYAKTQSVHHENPALWCGEDVI